MRRFVIAIFAVMVNICLAGAQNKSTLVQRINEIKSQTDMYFWDQYTHPNADTAKIYATKRLLLWINGDRNDDAQLSVEKAMPYIRYVTIDRGNLKQYFVYIKKTDAAAVGGVGQSASIVGMDSISTAPIASVQKSFVPDAFVERIMETKTFVDVFKLLESLQLQGQVVKFGKLKDVEDYASLDLILFDMQSQEIVTMLSPVTTSGNRINVVNGSDDSLDNYPANATAVIWYIRNK